VTAVSPRSVLAVLALCGLVATACSSSSPSGAAAAAPRRTLTIVAAENFWGSIVSQLAGRAGTVTSIVTDPNADPHSYESSSDDARAVASADYMVVNGAGYDAWAGHLLSGSPSSKRKMLTVAGLLGKKEGDNPHFWYNPDYVTRVTDRMEADLKALDPRDSAYFDAQRARLDKASAPYRTRLAEIKARFAGTPVGSTESIFVYLAGYLGLRLLSPPELMNAVAEGNDPPAPSVAQFQAEIARKQFKVLVYNKQTVTALTTNLERQAAGQSIPVVGVTEIMQPTGTTFEQWFGAELEQLRTALAR